MVYSTLLALLFVLLVGLTGVYGDQSGPLIRPSQLLVATVLDTASTEIVRDALMLFRSIRLFGSTFTQATFLIGITSDDDCAILDGSLLQSLYKLGLNLEIIYLPQTEYGRAKTLNKFKMFALFDSTRFDYFLWMDADITVFGDPMPYLHMHKYPGEIECVPDLYRYTIYIQLYIRIQLYI
ncbi:hypothetical protein B484DRAFT_223784, partial [Ochromonadaceae sp. CCMP2298]